MRSVALGVLVALGVSAAVVAQAEAFTASYDQTTTMGRQVTNSTVSMKDNKFRMEATMDGQASVTIHNDSGTFLYMPADGMAMKMPAASQRPVEHADNYPQYLQERNAEKIGSETVEGHACEIYRFTEPESGDLVTAWVWMEKQFPIRLEYDGSKGKMLVENRNIQTGNAIPDSAFELPANVQVMDMGGMMPQF